MHFYVNKIFISLFYQVFKITPLKKQPLHIEILLHVLVLATACQGLIIQLLVLASLSTRKMKINLYILCSLVKSGLGL